VPIVVATWNVNSIRARMHLLMPWLAEVSPDIVCLQETKVQDSSFPAEEIEHAGYHVVFSGEKSYNGVAILSNAPIEGVSAGFDDGGPPDAARLLAAETYGITLLNTYVPQGRDLDHEMFEYKLVWFGRLRSLVERRFKTSDRILWGGDLNVAPTPMDVWWSSERPDAEHVCYHPRVTAALETVTAWGFEDVFRKHHPEPEQFTYFDYRLKDGVESGKGWRIDHMLASAPLVETCSASWIDLAPRNGERPSDHTPLLASFDLS